MTARERRFRAAQLNFWLMRCGIDPIWELYWTVPLD